MKIYLIQIIIGANLNFSGSSGISLFSDWMHVFVEYDLFNITNLIQNLTYIGFGIIFRQFYINFSRQEHQIELLYVSINSRDSHGFRPIPPFIFPLQSHHLIFIIFNLLLMGFAYYVFGDIFMRLGWRIKIWQIFFWYKI